MSIQSELSAEEIKRRLTLLQTIEDGDNDGYNLIEEIMKKELYQAALKIAQGTSMPESQTQFMRGAYWAAEQMLLIAPKLKQKYVNDLTLKEIRSKEDTPQSSKL